MVVGLLIALATGVILILFTGGFSDILSKGADRNACRNSVVLKAFNPTKIGELNCRTNYVEINTLDQQEIMRKVAEEAYWCWWQFKEGEADFKSLGGFEGPVWCFLCSDIQFSDNVKEKYPDGIEGFDTFLQETTLKPKYNGNYADYLPIKYLSPEDPTYLETLSTISTEKMPIAFAIVESKQFAAKKGIAYDPAIYTSNFEAKHYFYGMVYGTENIQSMCNTLRVGEPLS